MNTYPVFRKDFRILSGIVAKVFILQAVINLLIPSLNMILESQYQTPFGHTPICEWFPKFQVAMNIILALVAAAYWSTEERAEKNDLLLRRLPASLRQIWTEKTAAAVVVLLGTLLIQWFWYFTATALGVKLWDKDDHVLLYMCNVTFLSYLVGLPLSCWLSQSVAVVLSGCGIMYPLMWTFSMWQMKNLHNYWWIILTWLIFILPFAALFIFNRVRGQRRLIARTKIEALVFKQIRENKIIYLLTGLLILFNIIILVLSYSPDLKYQIYNINIVFISIWGIFLPIILGITAYNILEKDGLRCVLYHHPIRRSTIYWTKFITNLIPTFILLTAFAIIYVISGQGRFIDSLFPLFLGGILLYSCGALITQGISRPLYAVFAALPFGLITALGAVYLYFQRKSVSQLMLYTDTNYPPVLSIQFGDLYCFCLLIFIGLSLAGWRAATDRQVLTGTPGYRFRYISRLVFFVLVASLFLIHTGWKDLFFLVTGWDIGIG